MTTARELLEQFRLPPLEVSPRELPNRYENAPARSGHITKAANGSTYIHRTNPDFIVHSGLWKCCRCGNKYEQQEMAFECAEMDLTLQLHESNRIG